jgi:hypothetical protein
MGSSNEIIIAGQRFPIEGASCVNFTEGPKFDSSSPWCNVAAGGPEMAGKGPPFAPAAGLGGTDRYRTRNMDFTVAAAKAKIKQFVIHLDGCDGATSCFNVLQNERGLSVHFILDNDGTIYQTLDLAHCAFHANGMNETSIGIEMCNRGEAKDIPHFYDGARYKRDVRMVKIQGDNILSFTFTEEQHRAMAALGKFIAKALPAIQLSYPNNAGPPG